MNEYVADLPVCYGDQYGGVGLAGPHDEDSGLAIEVALPHRGVHGALRRHGCDEGRDLLRADDRSREIAHPAEVPSVRPRVGDKHGILREQRCEILDATGPGCGEERRQQTAVLIAGYGEYAPLGSHMFAGALQELTARRFALSQDRGDLRVAEVERLVQQQHGAFGGRQSLSSALPRSPNMR